MSSLSSAKIAPSDNGGGYFENLPRYALPALQTAFDRTKSRQYKSQAIHTGLKRDLHELGVEPPTFPILNEWIDGILHGRIERPLGAIATNAEPATSPTAEPAPAELFTMLTPETWRHTAKADENALSDLVARVIDEKAAALQTDARRYAQLLIAEQLRELADELEASGS
ncbi:hypothetical protein [Rhizobium herbae]|uniref:DUF3486 family protein n=1 Tax=Rhizobium herbae TaxID=508661 RepID=A0ABS4EW40_9HYPH|nr:hypothetical protein [Rhizobium herbae]MBP1862175.1 hypothetical protein [Rhizobium herbae]